VEASRAGIGGSQGMNIEFLTDIEKEKKPGQ
jgi:hypothetical protein